MTNKFVHDFNIYTKGIMGDNEQLNQYGFRGPITNSEKTILFAGCSMTFGAGVEYWETFASQTVLKMGPEWSCLNIGIPGSGPDEQINSITWALNNFKIDKICWYISDPLRTTVLFNDDHKLRLIASDSNHYTTPDVEMFIKYHLYFEKNYLFKLKYNLYTLFSLIKHKNIRCYTTCWIDSFDQELEEFRKEFNFKSLGNIKLLDMGFDNSHPGVKSHLEFSKQIVETIQNDK